MGKLTRSVVGTVMLPMAFLPTAAWGATAPSVPVATTTSTASPTALPTATPTATAPPTDTKPGDEPTDSPAEPRSGRLAITPVTGPAGSVVTVKSVDKCVDDKGVVGKLAGVVVLSMNGLLGGDPATDPTVEPEVKEVVTAADGSWTTTVASPKTAKNGETFLITGACVYADPQEDGFLMYDPAFYMVVDAPSAPVAKPVKKNPTFTG